MTHRLTIWPAFLGGREARQVCRMPEPQPVYVCRPQRMAVGLSGRPLHQAAHAGAPPQDHGLAQVTAWLHRVGAEAPDYAEVRWPNGRTGTVDAAWIHPARNVVPLPHRAGADARGHG